MNTGLLAIRSTIGADGLSGSVNEKLRGRGKRSEMNLKFWKKEPKGIRLIEATYMDAITDLCPLAREKSIRRLVAYVMPKSHIHKNPAKDTGIQRVKYPSGNE